MTLTRPLAVFDLETTDPEASTCAIFEFGVTVIHPDGSRKQWSKRFKPWKPITPGAEEVTGVTNAMVADCPPFSESAAFIHRSISGKDIAGYNVYGFDIVALDQELRRCALKLDLTGVHVIDAFGIFSNKEPRNLTAAVMKYCGRSHEDAHGAQADADATADVLLAQVAHYEDLRDMPLEDLAKFSRRGDKDYVDLAQKLYRDADGDLRYAFGKVRDVKVRDDIGFSNWMLRNNFPGHTCEVLRAEFERLGL
jgi:DNA polymerase-3 subunit epsilon